MIDLFSFSLRACAYCIAGRNTKPKKKGSAAGCPLYEPDMLAVVFSQRDITNKQHHDPDLRIGIDN